MLLNKSDSLNSVINLLQDLDQFIPDLMFGVKNLDSDIVYFSGSHAKFLGFIPDDIIGKKTYHKLYDDSSVDKTLMEEDPEF